MSIHIYQSQGKQFFVVDPESLYLIYSSNPIGSLVREEEIPPSAEKTVEYDFDHPTDPRVRRIRELFEKYIVNMQKIADRLNLEVKGDGPTYCRNFKEIVLSSDIIAKRELDLSGLDLDLLPFIISVFSSVTELNLSHNNLKRLPEDLRLLRNLRRIDVSNNPSLILTKRVKDSLENVTIITDEPEPDLEKWAQTH